MTSNNDLKAYADMLALLLMARDQQLEALGKRPRWYQPFARARWDNQVRTVKQYALKLANDVTAPILGEMKAGKR